MVFVTPTQQGTWGSKRLVHNIIIHCNQCTQNLSCCAVKLTETFKYSVCPLGCVFVAEMAHYVYYRNSFI